MTKTMQLEKQFSINVTKLENEKNTKQRLKSKLLEMAENEAKLVNSQDQIIEDLENARKEMFKLHKKNQELEDNISNMSRSSKSEITQGKT